MWCVARVTCLVYITCFYVNFIIIHNIFVKDVTIVLLCNIVGL